MIASALKGLCVAIALVASLVGSTRASYSATISVVERDGTSVVLFRGDLNIDDVSKFRAAAGPLLKAIVSFESEGGSAIAGIQIGEIIRLKGFDTLVAKEALCASACAIAWLGGRQRFMSPDARIGFHAAYNAATGQETGVGNALVGAYLNQIGLPYSAVVYITQSAPDSMTWLNISEAKRKGIEVSLFEVSHDRVTHNPTGHPGAKTGGDAAPEKYADLLEAAERGDARSQFKLGNMHRLGRGVKQDYFKAAKWFRTAAEQGHVGAQNSLGVSYARGRGVRQDHAEAIKWYRKAAEQGYASAQNNLGVSYALGRGVGQDYAEAIEWFRKAAERGHASAQVNIAKRYFEGQGVAQDFSQAEMWFRKAAEQGHAGAQWFLGGMYAVGRPVTQDYVLAHMWWNLAAARGNRDAGQDRNYIEQRMTAAQIAEAQRLAREWILKKAR